MALNLAELGMLSGAAKLAAAAEARANAVMQSAARILVVDGETQVRSSIGVILESQGFRVQMAVSARQAIKILEENVFDLVLAEVLIQDGGGIALMENIRRRQPQLPVVLMNANHDAGVAVDSMRRGACDYLLKPFEREHLLGTVQRALERRQSLRENQSYQQNLEVVVQARTELLRQAIGDIEHSYDVTLEALGDALDLKDSETEGHSKRVTVYTVALARAMGLASAEIKIIARGAFLHDIGKMAIPDKILRKPGPLTPDERAIMREHCAHGYDMLRKIPFLREVAGIVLAHQEHHDGGGYPFGLRGSEIPTGARIFAIADALDAITSERPYRKARGFNEARREIQRCSRTQFDPDIVDVFLGIPNEVWRELRSQVDDQNKRISTFDIVDGPAPEEK